MAEADNTVDPNDLDSIDGLLDEAELETVEEDEVEAPEPKRPERSSENPETDQSEEKQDTDELLSDLESDLTEAETVPVEDAIAEEQVSSTPDSEPERKTEPEPEPEPQTPEVETQPQIMEDTAPSFIEKRAATQQANSELTVAEMDAIKKLIIIFSSVLIVLAVIGIGIGVWGALSAGSGLDEETMSQLSNIESASTQSLMKTNSTEKSVKTIDKKLDALSYQLEQLNSDILKLENQALAPAAQIPTVAPVNNQEKTSHDAHAAPQPQGGHGQNEHNAQSVVHGVPAPVQVMPVIKQPVQVAQPVMKVDPEMAMKLDKVSSQISSAQRRIMEVNKRVKSLQGQYKSLLRGMKSVEKQMVEMKVSSVPAEEPKEKKDGKAGEASYQYNSDGMYYDHGNIGAYP